MMFFKYNYNDPEFKFVTIRQTRNSRTTKFILNRNAIKYHTPVGISDLKKKDMLKLCEKNLIPAHHHKFYEDLPVNKQDASEDIVVEAQ